jgi:hypothetical protein
MPPAAFTRLNQNIAPWRDSAEVASTALVKRYGLIPADPGLGA